MSLFGVLYSWIVVFFNLHVNCSCIECRCFFCPLSIYCVYPHVSYPFSFSPVFLERIEKCMSVRTRTFFFLPNETWTTQGRWLFLSTPPLPSILSTLRNRDSQRKKFSALKKTPPGLALRGRERTYEGGGGARRGGGVGLSGLTLLVSTRFGSEVCIY